MMRGVCSLYVMIWIAVGVSFCGDAFEFWTGCGDGHGDDVHDRSRSGVVRGVGPLCRMIASLVRAVAWFVFGGSY